MTKLMTAIQGKMVTLREDIRGMELVQVVMVLLVAVFMGAFLIGALDTWYPEFWSAVETKIDALLDLSITE